MTAVFSAVRPRVLKKDRCSRCTEGYIGGSLTVLHAMRLLATKAAKFAAVFLCCTVGCTLLWSQFVTDTFYSCTDPGWLDFLSPGHWVHRPITVAHVVAGRSMSEPDTIRAGWSNTGLWYLWFSVVGVSSIVSAWLAWIPWIRERQRLVSTQNAVLRNR